MKEFLIIKEKKKIKKKKLFIFKLTFQILNILKIRGEKLKNDITHSGEISLFPLVDFRCQNYPNVCSIELYLQQTQLAWANKTFVHLL